MRKEFVIMLDMERELLADTFTTFDLVYAKQMPMFAKMYVDTKLPWLFGDNPEQAGTKKKTGMVGQMAGLYEKHKKSSDRKKE
jgi:hypothetical protein